MSVTSVNCVETTKDTATVAMESNRKPCVRKVSNGTILNDLERPLIKI